jgi:hypothetical protein
MGVGGCSKIGRERDASKVRPGFYVDRRALSCEFEVLERKLNDDAYFKTFIYVFLNYFFKIFLHT